MNTKQIKFLSKKYLNFFIYQRLENEEFPKEPFSNINFYSEELELIFEDDEIDSRLIAEEINKLYQSQFLIFG